MKTGEFTMNQRFNLITMNHLPRIVFLTLLLAMTTLAFADSFCNVEFIDSWKCPYYRTISTANCGLVYNNGYLYLAGADHIYALSTSDSGNIEFETTILEPEEPWIGSIVIRNNLAYVSLTSRITIYDVTDPLFFDSLGSCSVTYSNRLFLSNSILVSDARQLHVIDISDSTNPTYLRCYEKPGDNGLPAVCPDDYPYVFMPVMIYHDETHIPYWEAFINVIDITASYSSSPVLNALDTIPIHYFEAITKVGDYYIGADGGIGSGITFYMMNSPFLGARPIRHENVSSSRRNYLQALNDTLLYCGGQGGFQIVDVSDTASIEILAYFEDTDFDFIEVYYDCVLQDSFLYITSGHLNLDTYRDTMYVLSFKLDLDFNGQCENFEKPEEIEIKSYPNPFNSTCSIAYNLAEKTNDVTVGIYDIQGNLIDSYENMSSSDEILWDASGEASGVYLVKINGGQSQLSKKIIYMK